MPRKPSFSGLDEHVRDLPAFEYILFFMLFDGVDPSGDVDKIREIEKRFNEAFELRDPKALTEFYATDGTSQAPFEAPVRGQQALQKMFEQVLKDPNFTFAFRNESVEVAKAADLAWTTGTFSMTISEPGSSRRLKAPGYFQTVWKKTTNGDWKVQYDTMTPGPNTEQTSGAVQE